VQGLLLRLDLVDELEGQLFRPGGGALPEQRAFEQGLGDLLARAGDSNGHT